MFIWRPILAGVTTLHEVMTYWNLCDLADANEALDIKQDSEDFYQKEASKRRK
jgi:hypothetical protein